MTIRAYQVKVWYPPMCSPTDPDNYAYYVRDDAKEMAQCGFTWSWEMSGEFWGCFRGNGMIWIYFVMVFLQLRG